MSRTLAHDERVANFSNLIANLRPVAHYQGLVANLKFSLCIHHATPRCYKEQKRRKRRENVANVARHFAVRLQTLIGIEERWWRQLNTRENTRGCLVRRTHPHPPPPLFAQAKHMYTWTWATAFRAHGARAQSARRQKEWVINYDWLAKREAR